MLGLFKFYDSLSIRAQWITFIAGIIIGLALCVAGSFVPGWLGIIVTLVGIVLTYLVCGLTMRRA